jgi:sn-glycerol 3-phosphate transport system substrate-binding protein
MAATPSVNANDAIGSAIGGSALFMFNKNDETRKKASWDFVKFMSSVDVSAYWFINSGYFPLNNDALKTKYVQDALTQKPAKKSLLTILTNSEKYYKFQEPYMPTISVYNNAIGDQVALLAQGKQTVDQTVTNISKKAQGLLDNYNKANAK